MSRYLLLLLFFAFDANAAISFIAESTTNGTSQTTLTPGEPTGTAQNDLVLAFCSINQQDGTWTDPDDFTQIAQNNMGTGQVGDTYVGYKIRGSDAGSGYAFSYSGTAGTMRCTLETYRGTHTALDVTYNNTDHHIYYENDGALSAAQPITTNTDGAWVILLQYHRSDGSYTAGAPVGYTIRSDQQLTSRGHTIVSKEVTTAGTETPGVWTHTLVDIGDDSTNYTIALRPAATTPTFTVAPSCLATINGVSCTYTASATSTAYGVGVNPGDGAPSCTQIKAGQNDGGAAAYWTGSDSNTGTSDSVVVTGSSTPPRMDMHFCLNNAGGDSAVNSAQTNKDRSPDASQAIRVLSEAIAATSPFVVQSDTAGDTTLDSAVIAGMTDTSFLQAGMRVDVSAGFACSPCVVELVGVDSITLEEPATSNQTNVTTSIDVYYSPTVATGDIVEGDSNTSQGDAVTVGTDGDISWTDTSGGLCTSWDYNIQDVSDTSDGDFDSGPPGWASGDDTLYALCARPILSLDDVGVSGVVVLDEDVAMSSIDFSLFSEDQNDLDIDFSAAGFPNGTSLDPETGIWSGTPDTENEAGTSITVYAFNAAGLYATPDELIVYVVNTWTMPTITGDTVAAANATIEAAATWLTGIVQLTTTFACSDTVAANDIISQSPTASSEVDDPFQELSVVVATDSCLLRRRRR